MCGITDNSIHVLRTDTSRVMHIFWGYDGKIFLSGNSSNPWNGIRLHENEIQPIPMIFRKLGSKLLYCMYRFLRKPHIVIPKIIRRLIIKLRIVKQF